MKIIDFHTLSTCKKRFWKKKFWRSWIDRKFYGWLCWACSITHAMLTTGLSQTLRKFGHAAVGRVGNDKKKLLGIYLHNHYLCGLAFDLTLYPGAAILGFNLPLLFASTPETFKLRPDSEKEIALDEYTGNSLVFTKCRKYLDVRNDPTILRISVDAEKLSFFQTDWSTRLNYVTPDYISRFAFLETGAKLADRWSFSAMTVGKEQVAK